MARRKEVSRLELEARRMKRGEKRALSPDVNHDHSVVELSDESQSPFQSDQIQSKSPEYVFLLKIFQKSDKSIFREFIF